MDFFNQKEMPLLSVQLVKNRLGEKTGKALFDYKDKVSGEAAITKFHKRINFSGHVTEFRPFFEGKEAKSFK